MFTTKIKNRQGKTEVYVHRSLRLLLEWANGLIGPSRLVVQDYKGHAFVIERTRNKEWVVR